VVQVVRVSEVLAAVSLTTDLATGVPFERGLATALVAGRLAAAAALSADERTVVFHTALLGAVGCTSYASENAALFDDDTAFQAALRSIDPGDQTAFAGWLAGFGAWAGARRPDLAQRFLRSAPTEGPRAMLASCETSRALGPLLRLPAEAVAALEDVHERWDGRGIPGRRAGTQIALAVRAMHVAEQAVGAHAAGGVRAAVGEVSRRCGGHLDPDLAATFLADPDAILAVLDTPDLVAAVVAAEPGLAVVVTPAEIEDLCRALAIIVDLKGRYLLGHSDHVTALADAAAALCGYDDGERARLRAAALLHDLGRAGVPSSVWDRRGRLGAGDWERVRLHAYWTGRILARCPALADLATTAAAHHERLDGSGYHRGSSGADQAPEARLLAAADVFAAATEARAHRPALSDGDAAALLETHAHGGLLDRDACAAVIEAAGQPRARTTRPHGLTDREVEVLRLAARGLTNRQIAEHLVVSERTIGHHLAHIYDKTGRRSRAGAAVYAMEHGLLPEPSRRTMTA
jgi:HD-GYP domain-containing protein (c-di-GMP phosphodiesterase class II)